MTDGGHDMPIGAPAPAGVATEGARFGVAYPQRPVAREAELGKFAFDADLDGAEEVDVLAVRWGDALLRSCGRRLGHRASQSR
jgi:hypothetical protein